MKHTSLMQGFDVQEGIRSVHEAFRLGVNFFDTSPYYGLGKSEKVIIPIRLD